jgi:hypothetical protein
MLAPVVPVGLFFVGEYLSADAASVHLAHRHSRLSVTAQAVLLAGHGADCFNQEFFSLSLTSMALAYVVVVKSIGGI